ncbi:intein/intein [Streptomyces sp. Ag109_O5-1]|nr:intein/intein [Streptomyces sp. Ag109_O5-1]
MAAATIIITVATFGEGGLALAAARGGMRFGGGVLARGAEQAAVKTAEKTVAKTAAKAVEKKVAKSAEEKAAKAVEKKAVKSAEKSAAKTAEKDAGKTAEKDAGKASDAGEDAAESGGKCNSFTPDTRVLLADGKTKAIKDLKPGDKVKSTDPVLGGLGTQTVTATIQGHGTKHLVRLTLSNGKSITATDGKSITATDGHPIWLPKLHRWAKAKELRSGDWLQTSAGTYIQITAVRAWTQTATVNNLTVSSTHTYYVLAGTTAVLVHNCDDPAHADDCYCDFGDTPKPRADALSDDVWESAEASGAGITDAERAGDAGSIARGHANAKRGGEFPGMSAEDLETHVRDVMNNPARAKDLGSGRRAYQGNDGSTVVIHDPMSPDMGTVFNRSAATIDEYWNGLN